MEQTWQSIFAFVAFFLLVHCQMLFPTTSSASLTTDQSTLLALKAHIIQDPYGTITTNWTQSSNVCTWVGVTCGTRHQRVVALNISNMDVVGVIPPQLGNLSFVISLDLGYNHFSGNLPLELSRLHRLKVFILKVNNFNGEVPSWLGFLSKLEHLSLKNNSFTGYIPSAISNLSNLKVLDFSYNFLQGTIPNDLGNLGSLQVINMQYNYLSGPIPGVIFNLSALETIAFTSNKMNGSLPVDMCQYLPLLQGIYLSSNQLSGEIPTNISACSQLLFLSLSNNSFSGQIPKGVGKLKYLQTLLLGGNKLHGVIPLDIGFLQNLATFSIGLNHIVGEIPSCIFNLSSLKILDMGNNKLSGDLSRDIGNLTTLIFLNLQENNLTGVLPQEIGKLYHLAEISAEHNSFTGSIPPELFNISSLQILALTATGMEGSLPTSIGDGLPVLERLLLSINNLSGTIPDSISNCSRLRVLSLSMNKVTGFIPQSLGNLRFLESLHLNDNNLRIESSSQELSFIASLTNCGVLNHLAFGGNPLEGIIPHSVGNFSTSLRKLYANDCKIKGFIPEEIGNLSNLVILVLSNNGLTGNIPHGVQHLHELQGLFLANNNIGGSTPDFLCNLRNLVEIRLGQNRFSGLIPECLGNVTSSRYLSLESNALTSSIPSSIWRLKDLLELDLSSNSLIGSLPPDIGNLVMAYYINLSMNQLSEYIPSTIGKLENLADLSLAHNTLQGFIPESMGSMINLQSLDLSYNSLSGSIPMSLQALRHLNHLNVSFNALTGEIPSGGPFKDFTAESFKANKALCGNAGFDVPPCPKHGSRRKKVHLALFISLGGFGFLLVVSLTCIFFMVRYGRKGKEASRSDTLMPIIPERISYYELLTATEQFNESNLLGIGSFGSVYKGNFGEGKVLAVKVFNLQLEAAFKSFDIECEVLRSIRHRNLTKVLGSCTNEDFKALILEYMPNGNLEKWLHSNDCCLDGMQRLNIMIDVAFALEYLHHSYSMPIVHCDLKPSNVLLGEDMTAHVSDFGIAKLLGEDSVVHTNTLATLGYIAPEYGLDGLVSTRCDVYSYGIMLMETFTGKKPNDEIFEGDLSLRSWVDQGLLTKSLDQIIDANLLNLEKENFDKIMQCVLSILELALKCTIEYPTDRMNMKDALAELQKIKCRLFA